MPQKVLKFTGINRKVNEFQASGACEEMINLRADAFGGLRVVKPKHELETRTNYEKVYEHSFGDTSNIIAVNTSKQLVFVNAEGGPEVLCSMARGEIEVSTAGNVLVANNIDKNTQKVFRFVDDKYEEYEMDVKPLVNLEVSFNEDFVTSVTANAAGLTVPAIEHAMQAAASKFVTDNPNGLCGAAVVGLTYEFEDGSEAWSTGFIVANVSSYYKVPSPHVSVVAGDEVDVTVHGLSDVSLNYKFDSKSIGIAKRVNVYASRQLLPYEVRKEDGLFSAKKISLETLGVCDQPMHYVGSIDINKYGVVEGSMPLKFNMEQVAEGLMPVTSGCIERTGHTYSYNNRLFYYRSNVTHSVQIPCVQQSPYELMGSMEKHKWLAYVKLGKEAKDWTMVDYICELVEGAPADFTYPMAGVTELAFVQVNEDADGNITVPYDTVFYVSMSDSSAYNYSYALEIRPYIQPLTVNDDLYLTVKYLGQEWGNEFTKEVFWKKDNNAINASAAFNPFIFPVNYSYSFAGAVLDIVTAYMPISATQIGQYPLTVFTSAGVFSMEQGDGTVLFGNVVPIQPLVLTGRALATPHGTVFISANNLYLLVGREVTCVSEALSGALEDNIKEVPAYKKLCYMYGEAGDFSRNVSKTEFDEDITGATLSYDQLHNEVYINCDGTTKVYAYVLNLSTMQYHKTSRRHYVFQNGGRYALADGEYALSLVDLHKENKAVNKVLLQSRPFTLDAFLSHIQRMILLADAKLTGEQYLFVSVFASDDLNDWRCIISAQKANTALRHIRTNKAAKSYREYVVLINGVVSTDTDIADLLADYTIVTRRLG